jgi:hypothetical protein
MECIYVENIFLNFMGKEMSPRWDFVLASVCLLIG